MKRTVLSLTVILLVSGLLGSVAQAETLTGTVQSISGNTVVVRTANGATHTLQLGAGVTPAPGIATGSEVTINYNMDDDDMVASSIMMAGNRAPMGSQVGGTTEYGSRMPDTASPLGILALLGLIGLAGGAILRRIRVR